MGIILSNIKPQYMADEEVVNSDIFLHDRVYLESGQKYLIKANSGQGKSSLLNFIYGLNQDFEGELKFDKYSGYKPNLSYVFQDLKIFSDLTIYENILLKNRLTNHKTPEQILQLIEMVQLTPKKDTKAKKLSFGQRQRVAIIRAMCQPFDFLLMDEPFSHLDRNNVGILSKIIDYEVINNKSGLLMTTLGGDTDIFDFDRVFNL